MSSRKGKRIIFGTIIMTFFLIIIAASSVVGPVDRFKNACGEFFGSVFSTTAKEIVNIYGDRLEELGIDGLDGIEALPFSASIINKALEYDINAGDVKNRDGYSFMYTQEVECVRITPTTTYDTVTDYHLDKEKKLSTYSLTQAGCDNIVQSREKWKDTSTSETTVYYCGGHQRSVAVAGSESEKYKEIYGHYFDFKTADYLSGYDIPWCVLLSLAVVQKYTAGDMMEVDDMTGDRGFEYKITQKGLTKLHNLFSNENGVSHKLIFPFRELASEQALMKLFQMEEDEFTEAKMYESGSYYMMKNEDDEEEEALPGVAIMVSEIEGYIWHYKFRYSDPDENGIRYFLSGERKSRVEWFRKKLKAAGFEDGADSMLVAVLGAMPGGEFYANELENLMEYYDTTGEEYTEKLNEGIIWYVMQSKVELLRTEE